MTARRMRTVMALHCEVCSNVVDPDSKYYFYLYEASTDDDVTLCCSHCLAQYAQHVIENEEEPEEEDE